MRAKGVVRSSGASMHLRVVRRLGLRPELTAVAFALLLAVLPLSQWLPQLQRPGQWLVRNGSVLFHGSLLKSGPALAASAVAAAGLADRAAFAAAIAARAAGPSSAQAAGRVADLAAGSPGCCWVSVGGLAVSCDNSFRNTGEAPCLPWVHGRASWGSWL